jgi:hypothetical protein
MSSEENKYAVLMETNGKEFESWLYFIKYNGNEDALRHLSKQLESVEFYILDELSTFDIDLEHLVSERTAKEMTKVELNSVMYHRKFDGKLKKIDLGISRRDSNDKKILKCFKSLGVGKIDDFIDEEDIDPEDRVENPEEVDNSGTEYEYNISSDEESESEDERDRKHRKEGRDRKRDDSSDDEQERRKKKDKLKKK